MKKAFLCIHGFGTHSEGRKKGFSYGLRDGVKALLCDDLVWEEVLWDDLLGSPSSMSPVELALQAPGLVRAFYEGKEGEAIRIRAMEAVNDLSDKAGGAPVVVVGHSLGGAIAYETLARASVPAAGSLVMLAPPMGVFNHPEVYLRKALGAKGHGLGGLVANLGLDHLAAKMAHFPHVKGDRLPETMPAISFRNARDWFAIPLGEGFPDVSEREVKPPRGTKGIDHHRFYWRNPDVAASVAAAAVRAASDRGTPPSTAMEMKLLDQAAMDSLFAPERVEIGEDGEEWGVVS
jgi:pimeloyl-ACP methyl ester carboxylesterase